MGYWPMKYKNTRTGSIITTDAKLGGSWVLVSDTQETPKVVEKKPVKRETKRSK